MARSDSLKDVKEFKADGWIAIYIAVLTVFVSICTVSVEEVHRAIAFRSCLMIGRAAVRRATSLNPARANTFAVPTKIFDELFGALVSIGYASRAAAPAHFAHVKAAKIS
jgi:hypothetical protein